jgi:hypothetical protein
LVIDFGIETFSHDGAEFFRSSAAEGFNPYNTHYFEKSLHRQTNIRKLVTRFDLYLKLRIKPRKDALGLQSALSTNRPRQTLLLFPVSAKWEE